MKQAIHAINNHNASGLSYEELYRNAYNMVVNKFGEKLYQGLVAAESAHLEEVAERVNRATDESLLRVLKEEWDAHNKSVQMIRDIFMYMDRVYIPAQSGKIPVHQLGLDLWRDKIVRSPLIKQRMLSLFLNAVAKERASEPADRFLLKATSQMLSDLGLAVYEADLETPLLEMTAKFYASEAQHKISTCSAPAYLEYAEKRLAEEVDRVHAYLDSGEGSKTEPRLTGVLEQELIANQMRALIEMEGSGLIPMIDNDRYEDLSRMYLLFRHVQDGLMLLRTAMGDNLREIGKALVLDPERGKDPVEYVKSLLILKEKYDNITRTAFTNDKLFVHQIGAAFEHFINLNPRSPEYVSLYIDETLRKGSKGSTEDELESVLECAITLFRFLQEKDVFEKYYKQHLAKRLLGGKSSSEDAERSMLVKLKTECGYQFTSKLESMFTDMKTSQDTLSDFKAWMVGKHKAPLPVDLNVQVLTTGSWPTGSSTHVACTLPREVEAACGEFNAYYQDTFKSGRKLTWQTGMGSADLKATFNGKKHELSVSTQHMVVLLLFNESDSLTFSDILAATSIQEAELKRVMQSLACVKGKNILKKEPMGKDVASSDVFSVNDNFTSKLYKVKIGMIAGVRESEIEKAETRERVEEDRKPQIEAAIVRIMKTRKVLSHNDIVIEVTRQLSSRFVPQPAVIKKRIESLIDREFLERDATDRTMYRYLA